jgi:hypothetical protein
MTPLIGGHIRIRMIKVKIKIMTQYRKTKKNLDIENVLNHDVRGLKVNNKLHPKDSKKGFEDKPNIVVL